MEQCWFIPAADMTQVTTLCCFSRAGWCLEAFYWSLITQDPLATRGPTCLPKTVHFILASSVRCVCPVGSQHVAPEQVTTDTLACNWKWHCASGSNKRKVLKKWLFFRTFPSGKSECPRPLWSLQPVEKRDASLPSSALPMPACTGSSKRPLKRINPE